MTRALLQGAFVAALVMPASIAQAGFLTFIADLFAPKEAEGVFLDSSLNSQNMALLQAAVTGSPSLGRGGGDITVTGNALAPEAGPSGTLADAGDSPAPSGQISVYTVHAGDSLSAIAKMFGVSVNTISWANNLKNGIIHEGDTLVILPINGVLHTVAKGDTVASIAKKYGGDVEEIMAFNNLGSNSPLAVGEEIMVPDGKKAAPNTSVKPAASTAAKLRGTGGPALDGYFIRPVYGGVISQGLHGYNGVDFAANRGTTIVSAAAGRVEVAREGRCYSCNGGYGTYIVITHDNGTQTLYAHLDSISTRVGAYVEQGQLIGYSGNTGRSTGPHLHFEVRGAKNPFAK